MDFDRLIDIARSFSADHPIGVDSRNKHISLIIYKTKVITVGVNQTKTHPMAIKYGYNYGEVHSELDAYIRLRDTYKPGDLVLFNTRFNRKGCIRMARPCHKCMPWCKLLFSHIYYTTSENEILEL